MRDPEGTMPFLSVVEPPPVRRMHLELHAYGCRIVSAQGALEFVG
jgi:hypothetical protein